MIKFIHEMNYSTLHTLGITSDGTVDETITVETKAVTLSDVVDCFERFLKACGYHFDGHLDFVKEDYDEIPE